MKFRQRFQKFRVSSFRFMSTDQNSLLALAETAVAARASLPTMMSESKLFGCGSSSHSMSHLEWDRLKIINILCNGVVAFKVIQRRTKFLELNHKANERTKSRFSAPSLGLEFTHLFLRCKKSVKHMNVHTSSYPNNHLGALHASCTGGKGKRTAPTQDMNTCSVRL